MGYTEDDWRAGAKKLDADIARQMGQARTISANRFGSPST
jgi:hypothetical protein